MFERAVDLLDEVFACDGGRVVPASGALPSASLTPTQLIDRIAANERLINDLQSEQARDLVAFADARDAMDREDGVSGRLRGRTAATEVGLALRIAPMTAACRIAFAHCAVTDHLGLVDLLGTGRVSMGGLRLVLKATDVLHPEQRRTVAAQLAEDAVADRLTPGMLQRAATRRVLDVDPDAAEKRATASRNDRRISAVNQVDGTGVFWAKLRAEELTLVYQTLDTRARCLRAEGDERSLSDLMCDLLIESVTGLPMTPTDGTPAGIMTIGAAEPGGDRPDPDPWEPGIPDPYPDSWAPRDIAVLGSPPTSWRLAMKTEVQVVISAATLLGLDDAPCLLRGYGAIPVGVAREIVDNASNTTLRGLFADPVDGRLLAMDSTARCFTGGLRQFELYRDQHCRLTGGRIRDIDHVDEAVNGGPTTAGNGQGLAKNPHIIKDHADIHVAVDSSEPVGDGVDGLRVNAPSVVWTMPTGHSYPLAPPPALGEGSRPTSIPTPPPPREEPESVADLVRTLIQRVDQQPPPRPRKRRLPFVVRQEQRRRRRRQRRVDRSYNREDRTFRRDADDTHRRQARQARDRRNQRRQRQPV